MCSICDNTKICDVPAMSKCNQRKRKLFQMCGSRSNPIKVGKQNSRKIYWLFFYYIQVETYHDGFNFIFLFVVLLYHTMKFRWCQHCSWLYSQTDPWDLKVLIFARNSFPEVELASLFHWAVSFVKNSLYAYQNKFINN